MKDLNGLYVWYILGFAVWCRHIVTQRGCGMHTIRWEFYPLVATLPVAHAWLTMQADLGRAPATITAYGSALQDYLAFTSRHGVEPVTVTRAHLAAYVRDLSVRPDQRAAVPSAPLANATLQQRLTAVRLFYDYLVEEGLRQTSPVARGRAGARAERGLLPRYSHYPGSPQTRSGRPSSPPPGVSHSQPDHAAFAYDAALRRAELVRWRRATLIPRNACSASGRRSPRLTVSASCPTRRPPVCSTAPISSSGARLVATAAHCSSHSRRNRAQPSRSGPGPRWSRSLLPAPACRSSVRTRSAICV